MEPVCPPIHRLQSYAERRIAKSLRCSLPLLSEASFLPDKEVSTLCSVCECRLVTSEIRDRNGTPFLAWDCPRVNHHFRASGGKQVPLWLSLRPAAPILVPTLIAV